MSIETLEAMVAVVSRQSTAHAASAIAESDAKRTQDARREAEIESRKAAELQDAEYREDHGSWLHCAVKTFERVVGVPNKGESLIHDASEAECRVEHADEEAKLSNTHAAGALRAIKTADRQEESAKRLARDTTEAEARIEERARDSSAPVGHAPGIDSAVAGTEARAAAGDAQERTSSERVWDRALENAEQSSNDRFKEKLSEVEDSRKESLCGSLFHLAGTVWGLSGSVGNVWAGLTGAVLLGSLGGDQIAGNGFWQSTIQKDGLRADAHKLEEDDADGTAKHMSERVDAKEAEAKSTSDFMEDIRSRQIQSLA